LPGPETPAATPFAFSDAEIADVLARTEEGELLTVIMRSHGSSHARWLDRCKTDPELAARFNQAREYHADALAEGALEIIETQPERTVVLNSSNHPLSERIDTGFVAWQKARFDSRLKMLAFWAPGKYSETRRIDLGTAAGRALKVEDNRDPATMALAIAAALRAKKRDGEDHGLITSADIDDLV
jgi:hypothetical protein